MYLTGWRSGEVLPLRWTQVDFRVGVVHLDVGTTKNRDGRTFPFVVLPELEALLRGQREVTKALERIQDRIIPWVFHRDGEPMKGFRRAWQSALRRAGLPAERVPNDLPTDGGPKPRTGWGIPVGGHEADRTQDGKRLPALCHRVRE
jgi:integrase